MNSIRSIRMACALGVCLMLTCAESASAASSTPLGNPVAAPSQEQDAITLSGRTHNPSPEAWESMEEGLPIGAKEGAVAKFDGPELWVRNVSTATLSVFLPEPSKATGAALIIAPGGGFMQLAIDREGYSVARWLNRLGIAAFVLKYRLMPMPADPAAFVQSFTHELSIIQQRVSREPTEGGGTRDIFPPEMHAAMEAAREDGLEAVRYVRTHAAQWNLSPNRIGFMGFSAGAVTAIAVALTADRQSRPDIVASIYGLLPAGARVPPSAPPAFIAVAADDPVASGGSLAAYQAWRHAGVAAEMHVFERGGHGFGVLQQDRSSDEWLSLYSHWLVFHGFDPRVADARAPP